MFRTPKKKGLASLDDLITIDKIEDEGIKYCIWLDIWRIDLNPTPHI